MAPARGDERPCAAGDPVPAAGEVRFRQAPVYALREGDPKLSPNSYERERLGIRYIEEIFAGIKLKDLTPALIREREAQARKDGKRSESMLHKMHQKLRQVMQDAYLNEIIMRNPVDLVPFPRPRPKTERRSMTPEEIRRLFEATDDEGGAYATVLMLIAATALRKSEMLGLTWKYVDFERGQFFVANQRGAGKQLRPPKTTKSQRWLCIQGYMTDTLKAWRAEQAEYLALLGIEQRMIRRCSTASWAASSTRRIMIAGGTTSP